MWTVPNMITMGRIAFCPVLAGLIVTSQHELALAGEGKGSRKVVGGTNPGPSVGSDNGGVCYVGPERVRMLLLAAGRLAVPLGVAMYVLRSDHKQGRAYVLLLKRQYDDILFDLF